MRYAIKKKNATLLVQNRRSVGIGKTMCYQGV